MICDKVIFLHHHLSRSPSEFLHQLGLFYTSSVSTVSTFLHLWSVSLSNCLPVSYWLSDWVSEILLTFWTTLFWWLSREVNIYIFLHSITWGRPGCLLWHNNRNILTNWLVVASDMTQALQNNFLLKYYMPWLQECIKTNFLFKYCTQWLQEYCFRHVGTFCGNSKQIFFWSIVCHGCKNTIFCMLEYCVMHQNKFPV